MHINPNVNTGDTAVSDMAAGQVFDGNGGLSMKTQGVDLGNGTALVLDLSTGQLNGIAPSDTFHVRDDVEIGRIGGATAAGAAAPGGATAGQEGTHPGEAAQQARHGTISNQGGPRPAAAQQPSAGQRRR